MKIGQNLVLAVVIFVAFGTCPAVGQQVRYVGSVQYATGSYYFTERTGSLYFNNGLGISGRGAGLYINLPLITQNTPWISYTSTGVGPLPTGGPKNKLVDNHNNDTGMGHQMGRRKIDPGSTDTLNFAETHFGDPSLSAHLLIYESNYGATRINGNLGVKIPLADSNSGFGTGAWDLGGGLSWAQRIGGQYLLILSGMYWQLGDMEDLDFNNILSYSAALGRSFQNSKWMATANFFGSTEIINGIDPPMSVGAGLNYQLSTKLSLNTNMLVGLTESASDFSIGIGWGVVL